jgi:ornithine cyclodeaminase/alanine dehydrogenase-like protein (mu-crystallin family)
MPIVITDEDAERLLSIPEAIEAMRMAFGDFAEGKAVNPPRMRYASATGEAQRRYIANVHAGAVQSANVACVRAGSTFETMDARSSERKSTHDADGANWSVILLFDLTSGEPLAFMHEAYLSGFRVGATTALGVAQAAREDSTTLGLFGTGAQAFPNCRAVCAVRPIKTVKVFSPNAAHRAAFVARMAQVGHGDLKVVAVDDPREVVRGSDIVVCATNSKKPVFDGDWLEAGQMVVTIANSDVVNQRFEVDEKTFARADKIIINDWNSVVANKQVEVLGPLERGVIQRDTIVSLGDLVARRATVKTTLDSIVYYKNNSGLAIQFAACGAILHRKLLHEGTNRTIPLDWFRSKTYVP